jgi:hypothetical protein
MLKEDAPRATPTLKGRILSTEDDPDTRDLVRVLLNSKASNSSTPTVQKKLSPTHVLATLTYIS